MSLNLLLSLTHTDTLTEAGLSFCAGRGPLGEKKWNSDEAVVWSLPINT